MHADVEAVEVLESFPQLGALQNFAAVLAKQHVPHFDAPLHGNMEDGAFGGGGIDRTRVGGAFGSFLEEPGERNAGVQHQLDRHQRARRSPRASASACPAVRAPRILCRRRIFAAIRLPAARRFAATTLRAMITGSETFMAAVSRFSTRRFYSSAITGGDWTGKRVSPRDGARDGDRRRLRPLRVCAETFR